MLRRSLPRGSRACRTCIDSYKRMASVRAGPADECQIVLSRRWRVKKWRRLCWQERLRWCGDSSTSGCYRVAAHPEGLFVSHLPSLSTCGPKSVHFVALLSMFSLAFARPAAHQRETRADSRARRNEVHQTGLVSPEFLDAADVQLRLRDHCAPDRCGPFRRFSSNRILILASSAGQGRPSGSKVGVSGSCTGSMRGASLRRQPVRRRRNRRESAASSAARAAPAGAAPQQNSPDAAGCGGFWRGFGAAGSLAGRPGMHQVASWSKDVLTNTPLRRLACFLV